LFPFTIQSFDVTYFLDFLTFSGHILHTLLPYKYQGS